MNTVPCSHSKSYENKVLHLDNDAMHLVHKIDKSEKILPDESIPASENNLSTLVAEKVYQRIRNEIFNAQDEAYAAIQSDMQMHPYKYRADKGAARRFWSLVNSGISDFSQDIFENLEIDPLGKYHWPLLKQHIHEGVASLYKKCLRKSGLKKKRTSEDKKRSKKARRKESQNVYVSPTEEGDESMPAQHFGAKETVADRVAHQRFTTRAEVIEVANIHNPPAPHDSYYDVYFEIQAQHPHLKYHALREAAQREFMRRVEAYEEAKTAKKLITPRQKKGKGRKNRWHQRGSGDKHAPRIGDALALREPEDAARMNALLDDPNTTYHPFSLNDVSKRISKEALSIIHEIAPEVAVRDLDQDITTALS